jgi:hypothetical protein
MPWHFVLVETDGTPIGELTAAKAKKVIWPLDAAATASFTIDGLHPQALLPQELSTDLIVYDDAGVLRFRGRLGSSGDQVDTTGHLSTFSAVDYRGFMGRRILWPGNTATFTTVDQSLILWTLIHDSQMLTGGNLGITRGIGATTGITRTFTFTVGSTIDSLAQQIAAVTDGFEYEIDAHLAFNVFYPHRGIARTVVLDYGGTVLKVARALDTSKFANALRYSGASTLTPVTAESSSFGPAGRWETQIGDTSILDQPHLVLKADYELANDEVPDPSYALTLRSGWWNPDKVWLGDTANVVVKSGRLNVVTTQRIAQVEVDLGDDAGERVILTVGPVPDAYHSDRKSILSRLANLERT